MGTGSSTRPLLVMRSTRRVGDSLWTPKPRHPVPTREEAHHDGRVEGPAANRYERAEAEPSQKVRRRSASTETYPRTSARSARSRSCPRADHRPPRSSDRGNSRASARAGRRVGRARWPAPDRTASTSGRTPNSSLGASVSTSATPSSSRYTSKWYEASNSTPKSEFHGTPTRPRAP